MRETDRTHSSYPTTWNTQSQVSMPHNPGTASYPASSMPGDPYQQKMPLSGAPGYTAEPQDMHQTSMPSVQLSLVSQDQHGHSQQQPPPPIRTQFATYNTSSAPSHLSLSATTDSSLNVPRYVDNNPRPSKSPRHPSHQSVHSASSISADTTSGEYRYGPPTYASVGSSELSPQSQGHPAGGQQPQQQPSQPQTPYGAAPPPDSAAPAGPNLVTGGNNSSSAPVSASASGPPRDYFPPSQSWTTTAGETPTYGPNGAVAGGDRPYAFPAGAGKGPESHGHGHAGTGAPGAAYGVTHYAWNAT